MDNQCKVGKEWTSLTANSPWRCVEKVFYLTLTEYVFFLQILCLYRWNCVDCCRLEETTAEATFPVTIVQITERVNVLDI